MSILKKILKWAGIILVVAFVALLVGRGIYRIVDSKTQEQVAKIHATKLTLDDVFGKNLPPEPKKEEADKT